MSEADWWLCSDCQSLNNLSARKCYSCRRRKPKNAVRASEHLGYVPVKDQNGKVSLEMIRPPVEEQLARADTGPPPLRDPIPRTILAVAPQPPHGARITYQMTVAPAPAAAGFAPAPAGPPPLVAVGPGPAASTGGWPADAPTPVVADPTERWPHWSDLLDAPKPEGERLRAAYAPDVDASARTVGATASRKTPLSQAMGNAPERPPGQTDRFIPWPEIDRPAARTDPEHEPGDADGPAWPATAATTDDS